MCSNTTLNNITASIKEDATELFKDNLKKIILYGSYARGENDEESDIDIFLLVDMPPGKLSMYRSNIAKIASRLSLESEDCVTISIALQDVETYNKYKETLPFYANVDSEGVIVYAA